MDLFSNHIDPNENKLPYDGEVYFYGAILSPRQSNYYLQTLLNTLLWKNDTFYIAGKNIVTNRQIAWYGDRAFQLNYSNTQKFGNIWTKELLELKTIVEKRTNETYNSCLLNLYHSGEDGLGWHSDSEKGAVSSLSLGASRKFVFKHKKTKGKVEFNLTNGDLLIMKGKTQKYWMHRVPSTKKILKPRINLTFRTIKF